MGARWEYQSSREKRMRIILACLLTCFVIGSVSAQTQPVTEDTNRLKDLVVKLVDVNDRLGTQLAESRDRLSTAEALLTVILKAESLEDVDKALETYGLTREANQRAQE